MNGLTSSPWTEQDAWDDLTDRLKHAEAERDRLAAERDDLRARLAAVEALADAYDADARHEGYGGELWSTTAAAIRKALRGDR